MRKGIAYLLTLVLLLTPLSGLAEAVQLTIDPDLTLTKDVLSAMAIEADTESETLLDAVNALLSGIALRMTYQQNAARLELLMRDGVLMDATLTTDGAGLVLSSSIIPGVKLAMRPDRAQIRQTADAISRVDGEAIIQRLTECFREWLAGCAPAVTETGSFAGDAYENGVKRTTYRFNDRDLATLLSGMGAALNADAAVRSIIHLLDDSLPVTLLDEAREFNRMVGLKNEYGYQLSLVEREDGALCGASLTVLRAGAEQVSTFSAGFLEDSVRFVWGYGLDGLNYYADVTVAERERTQTSWKLECDAAIYEDELFAGYQAARQGEAVWSLAQEIVETTVANETVADMTITIRERDFPAYRYEIHRNAHMEPYSEQVTLTAYIGNEQCVTETITGETIEAFDPAQNDLREISLLPEIDAQAQAELDEAFQAGLSALTVQLFKLAPPEAITLLLMEGIGLPVESK